MSEYNDIAGSDDIITLTYDTQETFNEHSYRCKQTVNRIDKSISVKDQAKENKKPIEQANEEETDIMQAETQNYSQPIVNNEVPADEPATNIDTQNTLSSTSPFVIRPPLAQSTLTDESSISADKDSIIIESQINDENNTLTEPPSKSTLSVVTTGLDTTTAANNLRLYISPAASLHETATMDDAQPNPINTLTADNEVNYHETEVDNKPKEEPMDTSDAQVSLGSDGIIESNHTSVPSNHESTSVTEKSTKVQSTVQNRTSNSPKSKASYALSQPTTDKFDAILAKLTTSTTNSTNNDSNITIREEEEIYIKESISKTLRRYAVKVDPDGRIISRDLLLERVVEENTTTRIESWPPSDKKPLRTNAAAASTSAPAKPIQPVQSARKKSAKSVTPKRRTKSLKPTATPTTVSSKKIITIRSDDDDNDDDVINVEPDEVSSDDNKDDDEDDEPTGNLSGEEFMPTNSSGQPIKKGLRVYAKWRDGNFYPGIVGHVAGEKYMIVYDDGAKYSVKMRDLISQSYLDINQTVRIQTPDGSFPNGIVKRLIKKRKTGNIGYIIESDGKEKWYPLQFVSLTPEQAEQIRVATNNNTEEVTLSVQGKRKRTSTVPQSPNKKTKNSALSSSPNKNQRATFTPTRQTKLFNSMNFLVTGFSDSINTRLEIQNAIEGHGGKVIEKIPPTNQRDNVYLISDKTRKTIKFFEAKKLNLPCVNYKWINESIEKSEVQEWENYKLVLPDREIKVNENNED